MSVSSLFSKGPVSSELDTFNARANEPRDTACFKHTAVGWTHAPRPGRIARSSTTSRSPWATTLSSTSCVARWRQATHVRSGSILPASHTPCRAHDSDGGGTLRW